MSKNKKKKKVDFNEKNLFGEKTSIKVEEKLYFKFEKGIFDEKLINFNDIENIVKNTKNLIDNSLIELDKQKLIISKDIVKVNIHRSSFNFEIFIPYIVNIAIENKELLFTFLQNLISGLKVKYDSDNDFSTIKNNPIFNNKNINGSVYNVTNNYYLNFSIENNNGEKSINFVDESDRVNIKENLEKLNIVKKYMEIENHLGRLVQANINKNSKDLFQPKDSKEEIKIEFPNLDESEKTKLFTKKEILIQGETYYCDDIIEKIIVKEVLTLNNGDLSKFIDKDKITSIEKI